MVNLFHFAAHMVPTILSNVTIHSLQIIKISKPSRGQQKGTIRIKMKVVSFLKQKMRNLVSLDEMFDIQLFCLPLNSYLSQNVTKLKG